MESDEGEKQVRETFLYVLRADPGVLKVGSSFNPLMRLLSFRYGNFRPSLAPPSGTDLSDIRLIYQMVAPIPGGRYNSESQLHRLLRRYYICSEWFRESSGTYRILERFGMKPVPVEASTVCKKRIAQSKWRAARVAR